jgi:hypothetical protein
MPLTTMIVRRIRPETSRFLLTITGERGGSPEGEGCRTATHDREADPA